MTFRNDALAGQHIVISGGGGALGVAIVKALTDHGANMTVNDIIDPAAANERLAEAGVNAERYTYFQGDLSDPAAVTAFVTAGRERFGVLHTALCHTGVVISGSLLDYTVEDWDKTQATNVRSAFLLGQAAARAMLADEVAGQLVFTTSWVSETPWPNIGPYNTSKAAMNQLMRSFARELADKNIRANAVAPGIVAAGMALRQWNTEPDYRARAEKAIPLGFMQPLESVADAFLFMCSPASRYMTGSVLLVDGGCNLYPMD